MTVSYSLDVAKARFCGLAQLLGRWRGGIYKIIWRETLIFCLAYTVLSVTYRCYLDEDQKILFEKVVIFVENCIDLIPLSFVLGFYVSLVIGRWWSQYETIPWPDRLAFSISSYIHGNDERSRLIRRTLARYVILTKVLTFQAVSTSVKRRFPTTQHLVAAGIMTQSEKRVYDKVSFSHGKWWLPLHWFTALATRARNEGRIKDSVLLNGLLKEAYDFRTSCAIMFGYDWISVPLVYTQVVTIATYMYSIALIVGRQFIDPEKGYPNHNVDFYVPIFTLLQFFFYIGWLKVAEQILNPYGEDDDDFELNWCLDRAIHLSYLTVDHLRMKHPKVEKDYYWDETDVVLPQTKQSRLFGQPQLGSAFYLDVDEAEYLPLDELLEKDEEGNIYSSDSVKRVRPSLLRRILSSGLRQSQKSKSLRKTVLNRNNSKGYSNRGYEEASEIKVNNIGHRKPVLRQESLNNTLGKESPRHRTSSASFRPNTLTHKSKSYEVQSRANIELSNKKNSHQANGENDTVVKTVSAPAAVSFSNEIERDTAERNSDNCLESDGEAEDVMPSIPEEIARATSSAGPNTTTNSMLGRCSVKRLDAVQNLVEDANKMLREIKRSISMDDEDKNAERPNTEFSSSENNGMSEGDGSITEKREDASKISVVIEMERHEENQS